MSNQLLQGYLRETLGSLFAIEKPPPSATAPMSGVETERAAAAMAAAEQLSMMSAGGGVACGVSTSANNPEVVLVQEVTYVE